MSRIAAHGAYAGETTLDRWRTVEIKRLYAQDAAMVFGSSPLMKTPRGPGWYWRRAGATAPIEWRGPFNSSRRALWNARDRMPLVQGKE